MDASLAAELREAAGRALSAHAAAGRRAEVLDRDLWHLSTAELGWLALPVAEADGGLGLGLPGAALVMELAGEHLPSLPLYEALGAVLMLGAVADAEARAAALAPLLDGGVIAVPVICADAAAPQIPAARIVAGASGPVLHGRAAHVASAHLADRLVVLAARAGDDAPCLCVVDARDPAVRITTGTAYDPLRPVAAVEFAGVALGAADCLALSQADGMIPALALLLAAEQTGLAAGALAMTTDYVKTRTQFGRTIGSFQAVKHTLADMMLQLEAARSALMLGVDAAEHSDAASAAEAAHVAMATCSDAALFCTAEAIQMHGGIGFTWDYPAHYFFKRARSSALILGSPDWHREQIACALRLDESNS